MIFLCSECNIGFGVWWYSSSLHERKMKIVRLSQQHVLKCDQFLVNPSSTERYNKGGGGGWWLAHHTKWQSIISCHLCACDWCVCVSVCVCSCWMLEWENQCRHEHQWLSVAHCPHYSSPPSLQSGPALLPLAAKVFSFVYVLHICTNTKALSLWCSCLHLNRCVYHLNYFYLTRD